MAYCAVKPRRPSKATAAATRSRCPCGGAGLFAPATPSCEIRACAGKQSWAVVERCDCCERFTDDLAAALSKYSVAGWFPCSDGGWHVLAAPASLRSDRAERAGRRGPSPLRPGYGRRGAPRIRGGSR